MITLTPEATLQDTMGKLETSLLSPVVPGELRQWIGNVQQAAATFSVDWTRYVHSVLHVQYREIASSDPEMLTLVEQMVQSDQQLMADFAAFQEALQSLHRRATAVDKHESKLDELQDGVEQLGIALIVRIKKQQATAGTWLVEAMYRDRGVKD